RRRGRVLVQHRREELVAVAAEVLGAIHGEVREPEERRHVLAVLRHAGDADARAGAHLVLADAVGLAELVQELLRHRGGLARVGDVLQQHAELIAADTRTEAFSREEIILRSASPTSWPSVSFTVLKLSRSMKSSAAVFWWRRACATASRARSENIARFGRPVSVS